MQKTLYTLPPDCSRTQIVWQDLEASNYFFALAITFQSPTLCFLLNFVFFFNPWVFIFQCRLNLRHFCSRLLWSTDYYHMNEYFLLKHIQPCWARFRSQRATESFTLSRSQENFFVFAREKIFSCESTTLLWKPAFFV